MVMVSSMIIIVFLLMFLGLAGIVLPILPGPLLSWIGFFLYAWSHHFEKISVLTTLIFLGFVLLLGILDYILPIIGAKKYKTSRKGIFGAGLGLFLGVLFFGSLGIILGPFLGTLLGEVSDKKDVLGAIKSARSTIIGVLISAFAKVVLIFIMTGFVIVALIGEGV